MKLKTKIKEASKPKGKSDKDRVVKETKFIPSNFLEPARKEEVINERWVIKIETKKVTLRIAETNWDKLSIINTRTAN